jgi:hypothetical protein
VERLSIIGVPGLKKLSDSPVGKRPAGLDYCAVSGTVFATDEESGGLWWSMPGAEPW